MEAAPVTDPELAVRARRQGPLPYSASGRAPKQAIPGVDALVDWEVDAVDASWSALGRPDPFALVEIGAGDGSRAAVFLGRGPQCLAALRYVLVEEDARCRDRHSAHVPVESPVLVLGPVGATEDEDDDEDEDGAATRLAGLGPLITSLGEPPVVAGPTMVIAVGWLSRFPSDRLEWRDGRWWEVRLAATELPADQPETLGLRELLVPLDPERATLAETLTGAVPRPDGARFAQLGPAVSWLADTLQVAESGWLAVVDRWTELTSPLPSGRQPALSLDQLAPVRRPVEPAPVEIFPGWSAVMWRLG